MKISPLAILAFVLSWDQASAFVPNTCPVTLSAAVTASHPHTATICFASAFDGASGGSQTRFPYDDDAIRFAYDEWRLIYGKGDFDRYRFENFKTNYKTLTMANIQARDKALKQGQPTPQWMSLNEYGDYSVAEYEAMLQGRLAGEETTKKAPFPVSSPASYQYNNGVNGADELQDQYGRPIRSTQVVQPGGGRGTQVVSGGNAPRGTQVIQSASQQSAFDQSMTYSGYGGEEYQDQFGRTIRPTQVLQSSYPQQQSSWSSGTQVIQQSASPRGTQVISSSGANNGGTRGTQVISKSNDSSFTRGTQVIQSNSGSIGSSFARGTQVVGSSSNGYSSSYGTQVIQSSPTGSSGTQVIRSDSPSVVPPSSYGTQVKIGAENSEGTQVIKQSFSDDASGRGTLVINKDDKETWSKYSNDLPAGEEDDEVSSSVAKRGTMVIKRQIPEPEPESPFPNFFDIFSSKSDKKRETVIIDKTPTKNADEQTKSYGGIFSFFGGSKSGDDTVATTQQQIDKNEKAPEETEKTSIFSLFSGKQTNDDSRPVRGTVILPNAGKTKPKQPDDKRRKTVLIPKKPEEDGLPSILSFFGGAKKVTEEEAARNPNARPTLQIKKPKKQTWSLFPNSDENEGDSPPANFAPNPTQKNDKLAAQLAKQRLAVENAAKKKAAMLKEREAKRKELQEKRRQATERRVARVQGKSSAPQQPKRPLITALGQPIMSRSNEAQSRKTMPAIRPPLRTPQLSFFGTSQVPEIRRWRQNFDGSITGLIYKSKSFEDGTRVTTSPVARGAKKGTTVTTSGGTKYFLQ